MIRSASPWERVIAKEIQAAGWNVTRTGWPDFLCWRDIAEGRQAACVEVKAVGDKLSQAQIQNHEILRSIGVPVIVEWIEHKIWTESVVQKIYDELRIRESVAQRVHEQLRKGAA